MEYKNIVEVKETTNSGEVNSLLRFGEWILIDSKIEKIRVAVGKEKVGIDFVPAGFFNDGLQSNRLEIKYEEKLTALYILGKIDPSKN